MGSYMMLHRKSASMPRTEKMKANYYLLLAYQVGCRMLLYVPAKKQEVVASSQEYDCLRQRITEGHYLEALILQ